MQHFLTKLLEPKPNGPEVALLLTKLLGARISRTTLRKEIEEHPNYPSLLSISDVLNHYGVANLTAKFDVGKFSGIPTPFITQIKGMKRHTDFFSVVKHIDTSGVHFFDPEKLRWDRIAREDFLKRYSGIVLLAEVDEHAGERKYEEKVRKERVEAYTRYFTVLCLPVIVLFAGLWAFVQGGRAALLPSLFSLLTLAGSAVCVLLLWYEVDQYNPVLQQICSSRKKVSCGAVLQSKASKIAGISWSAVGFSYFTGLLLLLLFSGVANPVVLAFAACTTAVVVPYTFFSVYYQWRVARQWCALCLSVQVILIFQLITAISGGWFTQSMPRAMWHELFLPAVTAFAVPVIGIVLILPALKTSKKSNRNYNELQKLKHNRQVFEALLQKQAPLTEDPKGLGIMLGNPDAPFKLIKVCNPYCGPCAQAHTPLEELLVNNPDVCLQIVFTAADTEDDTKAPPVKHLMAIAANNPEETVKRALGDWYLAEKKDYNAFAAKYPMNGELKQQSAKVGSMRTWCEKVNIEFTPTFFVSVPGEEGQTGYFQLPKMYQVADLKYFFSI